MPRSPNDNDSPFYIDVTDNSGLDQTDTVFSEVVRGMEVEDEILAVNQPVDRKGAILGIWFSGARQYIWSCGLGQTYSPPLNRQGSSSSARPMSDRIIPAPPIRPTRAARAAEITSLWRLGIR